MAPFFGLRTGNAIKLGKTTSRPDRIYPKSQIHYFKTYRAARHYVFGPSFASPHEKKRIRTNQLDLIVYTDGGQRNSNDGAWAYSINDAVHQLTFNAHYFNTKNNNYCELEALIQVLRFLINVQKYNLRIQVDTDSVSVKSITWNIRHGISIESIARNSEWQIGQLRTLKRYLHRFDHLQIHQVKGHAGILGNQLVHQLCSKAMCISYSDSYDPFKINRKDIEFKRMNKEKSGHF